jgi:hypothetical protein
LRFARLKREPDLGPAVREARGAIPAALSTARAATLTCAYCKYQSRNQREHYRHVTELCSKKPPRRAATVA